MNRKCTFHQLNFRFPVIYRNPTLAKTMRRNLPVRLLSFSDPSLHGSGLFSATLLSNAVVVVVVVVAITSYQSQ